MRIVSASLASTTMVLVRSSATMTGCFSTGAPWGRGAPVGLKRLFSTWVAMRAASAYCSGMTESCCPLPGTSICLRIFIRRWMLDCTSVMMSVLAGA